MRTPAFVQPHGDGIEASALGSPTEHPLHHNGGNGVDDKLVAIVLGFQIAVGSTRTDELAVLHGLPLLRPDLAPNVQSVGFVYHVPQRDDDTGMGILRVGGVEVFIDRNKADVADAEILLDVIAGVDGVPSQTGEVFHNDAVDVTGLNIREHLLKARTVEVCPGRAVVDVGIVHADLRVLLQIAGNNHLLGFNGYAVRVGILHRKADVDRGAASGVGLLHGHRSRFFSAFFSPCSAHLSLFVIFLLRCQRQKLQRLFVFVLMGKGNIQLLFPTDADALYHVNERPAV